MNVARALYSLLTWSAQPLLRVTREDLSQQPRLVELQVR